ncbi:MAG TPA: hypothetical protein VF821_23745 [Lentzea sp.]
MTTNPAEVVLTSRGSATVQRVLAGVSIVATLAGGVAIALTGQVWWAVLLQELGVLVLLLVLLALWGSAGANAEETTALVAAGEQVHAEVTEISRYDNGEGWMYELTLRIPLPDGDVETLHRCTRSECAQRPPGSRVVVLIDHTTRNWAVLH